MLRKNFFNDGTYEAIQEICGYCRKWRQEHMRQYEAASIIGCSQNTVGSFERGRTYSLAMVLEYGMMGMPLDEVVKIYRKHKRKEVL